MKKIIVCLLLAAAVACIAFNAPFLLAGYAALFSAHNATPGADALVVLGGRIETRFPCALELYRQGYAPQILLTDIRPYTLGIPGFGCSERSIALAMRDHFNPAAPVAVVPSRSGKKTVSTFDEAWDLLHYSRLNNCTRLVIVTDQFHTRRALYAFRKVFEGSGVAIEAMGAPNAVFSAANWWRSDAGLKAYLLEPLLMLVYLATSSNLSFLENY
jgi:uncharacterized SAM-binding protein YcdF (DUF218 family)